MVHASTARQKKPPAPQGAGGWWNFGCELIVSDHERHPTTGLRIRKARFRVVWQVGLVMVCGKS